MINLTSIQRLAALCLVLCLIGCAASLPVPQPMPSEVQQFDQIVHTLADPSMEGRGAGTAGLDQARDYLVEQFQRIGLLPGFTGESGESFTQALEISLGVQVDEQALTWTTDGKPYVLKGGREADFNTLGLSGSQTFKNSEVVFVGYAITDEEHNYDSLGGDTDALQGRVAIAYRYEPRDAEGKSQWSNDKRWTKSATLASKAKWAQDRGAVALLIVNPPSHDDGRSLHSTRKTGSGDDIEIPVFHMDRKVLGNMLKASGRYPQSAMRTYEKQADRGGGRVDFLNISIAGSAKLSNPKATIYNIAAILPGVGDLADQAVIFGGHYDHLGFGGRGSFADEQVLHPGADDNASGIAAVLMLAQRWQQRIANDPHAARRTLVFMPFSGEERGLLGSAHLTKHSDELNFDFSNAVAMLNCDMIGRMRDHELHVYGGDSGKQWASLLKRVNRATRLTLLPHGSPIGPSDHASFYRAGMPVIHFYTGGHENYHRPTDTPDLINALGGAQIVNFADALLAELVYGERVSYVEVETAHASNNAMIGDTSGGAYLGVMPDYKTMEGTQGCGIDHVTAGSPAEAGGLKTGDILIQWNEKTIGNLQQFSDALRSANPGDEVMLVVLRKDDKQTLNITLGKR